MIVVPVSILLAILINFGILEKNSEITAIKAGGWSLYRISLPIFLICRRILRQHIFAAGLHSSLRKHAPGKHTQYDKGPASSNVQSHAEKVDFRGIGTDL